MAFCLYLYKYHAELGRNMHPGAEYIQDLGVAVEKALLGAKKHPEIMLCDGGDNAILSLMDGGVALFNHVHESVTDEIRAMINALPLHQPLHCHTCQKDYAPCLPARQGLPWQREQHMSGTCSQECWDRMFGKPKRKKA